MAIMSDYLGLWRVDNTEYYPNVNKEEPSQNSRILLTHSASDGANKVRCTNITSMYVKNAEAANLPVNWEGELFTFHESSGWVIGYVDSANNTPQSIVFRYVDGTVTCVVNGGNAPGGIWTGTHPT